MKFFGWQIAKGTGKLLIKCSHGPRLQALTPTVTASLVQYSERQLTVEQPIDFSEANWCGYTVAYLLLNRFVNNNRYVNNASS